MQNKFIKKLLLLFLISYFGIINAGSISAMLPSIVGPTVRGIGTSLLAANPSVTEISPATSPIGTISVAVFTVLGNVGTSVASLIPSF